MTPRPVCLCGSIKPHTGYGLIPEMVGRALESLGVPVLFADYGMDRHTHGLPPYVRDRLRGDDRPPRQVHFAPPDVPFEGGVDTTFFTMWESTGLPACGPSLLNRADRVCVPSLFNAATFRQAGVRAPIHLVPLAVDHDVFTPGPRRQSGTFVVGMAARLAAGGCRKGLREGMAAFCDAFADGGEDVRLDVRVPESDARTFGAADDPRIRVETTPLSPAGLARWYRSLDVLLVPTKGEGFGLHTLEAMACGVPVVAANWSGTSAFFDASCGWEVAYDLEPAGGVYAGCGEWAVPRHGSMVAALREAYADRGRLESRGRAAHERASHYTWRRTAAALLSVIGE